MTTTNDQLTTTNDSDADKDADNDDDNNDDDSETYELLVNFKVKENEYGLYIPLDPFFVVAKLKDGIATLVEGEEFDQIQPRIERELEETEFFD